MLRGVQGGHAWCRGEMERMLALVMLSLCLMQGTCQVRNEFRTGAVLAESGEVKEMVDARRGYEVGVDAVNRLNGGQGFGVKDRSGTSFYFRFGFEALDDESQQGKHTELLESLLRGNQSVDFLFGSHPKFAFEETRLANGFERINVQCCVGPDEVYQQNFQYVFGIPVSNRKYPEATFQSMVLRKMKRLAVAVRKDNSFTESTCEAALALAKRVTDVDHDYIQVKVKYAYDGEGATNADFFKEFVDDCVKHNVDAVIACTLLDDGKVLMDAFYEGKKSMKAFFMTVGPSNAEWVEDMGEKADYLLSAGQWHPELAYSDKVFGTNTEYVQKYKDLHGEREEPSYISAGASAAVYTAMAGIQNAFIDCDILSTGGDIDQLLFNPDAISCGDRERINGYERVRMALEGVDLETFFGRIKFNIYRQNVGNDPATTQVLKNKDGTRGIDGVLPIKAAKASLVMPAKNKFKPKCFPGYYTGSDDFDPCQPCEPGKFSVEKNSAHCDHCPAGSFSSQKGQKECTPCPDGTITDGPGAKGPEQCFCKDGHYNSNQQNGVECFHCPEGAHCRGKTDLPIPLQGYWMNETWREAAYECDSERVCVGGSDLACRTGYTGRMCSECSDGYYGVISYCYECPSKGLVVLFIVVVVLGWYVINVVVSKNVASLDMILSWAQLANVIGDVDLRWPQNLQLMFGVANVLDFDVDILEPSCLTNWSFRHNHLVQLSLPFLMSLMACLGYLSSCVVHKLKGFVSAPNMNRLDRWLGWLVTVPYDEAELSAKWDATIATFLSSIEVTYITVAKYCFDVFKCDEIAGVSVLRSTPSIECGTHEHRILKILGVVGTLGYSFGYIVFVSWKIWQLYTHRTFQEAQNLRRYGFLYCRFELDYCWTAIVVLARRLLFVVVLVFVNNPGFQAGALAIIINASLMLHVYTAPYVDTYLDVMFSFLLVALMCESFSGVLFYSTNLPSSNREILEWIVLVILFALVAISIYFLMAELKKKFQNHIVRQLHCKELMRKSSGPGICNMPIFSMVSSEARGAKKKVSDELLGTFDSSFLYSAIGKHPEHVQNWDKLNQILKEYMSDQAECSYLSREPVAKFWRKLVDRFPELVDFLAVANKEKREHFCAFATTLYQDFYLTNKIKQLPIFSVLNWRDRAPMAQWLAMADEPEREFFTSFMLDLFKASGRTDISSFDKKIPELLATESTDDEDPSSNILARTWTSVWSGKRSVSKELVLAELQSGRSPLETKTKPSFRSAALHVQAAVSLRLSAATRRMRKIHEKDHEDV